MTAKARTQSVREEETSDDLPEGWAVASTADLFTFVTSGSRGWAKYYAERGALFLTIANLDHDSITIDLSKKRFVRPPSSAEGTRTRVRLRDLLVSITADVGMIGLIANDPGEAYINQHIALARPVAGLDEGYLAWYLTSSSGQKQLEDLQRGATKVGLGLEDIRSVSVPFAPVVEQRRIVAKIEELLESLNVTRDRLRKVHKILAAFRQSVLAAACFGHLTEDWRRKHPGVDHPSTVILSIGQRRAAKASTSAEKENLRTIYDHVEEGNSDDLPESWCFVALNKLSESLDYGTSAKSSPSGTVPVLRMGNIQRGEIDWSDLVYTSEKTEIQKYTLQANTVLFNRTNSPELVGKTAIYRGEREAIFAGYLIRIVTIPELDPEYLNLCLNTVYAREFCSRVKTDGVSQSNINAQKLGLFELPYCCIAEQHEIVRRAGILFKLADKIERRVEAATKRADKLIQAILAKAFRGELVPTEAELARQEGRDYEPASGLLARIKAERERASVVSSIGTGRRSGRATSTKLRRK